MGSAQISKGHPYFRLAVLHLQTDADESVAISFLELAYAEDQKYGPNVGKEPHRMGAYRLLSLTKGFLTYLREQKNWQTEQLKEPHRLALIRTLLAVYDGSLVHILDRTGHTYQSFFTLISHRGLLRFAIENYYCAENLLEVYFAQNRFIAGHTGEYPLARAIVGLLAGVLEAILADRLPNVRSKTLGGLIAEASKGGIIQVGTKVAALSSLMLYLRNFIHADRQAGQFEYFIDMNVANGCRVALDWAISDMLQAGERQSSAASSTI